MQTLYLEGVAYHRYRLRFQLADGRRRSWVRWSPGLDFARNEFARELEATFGIEGIKPGTLTIETL